MTESRAYGGNVRSLRPIIAYHASEEPHDKYEDTSHDDKDDSLAGNLHKSIKEIFEGGAAHHFSESEDVARLRGERSLDRPEIVSLKVGNKRVGPYNGFDYSPKTRDPHENITASLIEHLLLHEGDMADDPENAPRKMVQEHLDTLIDDYEHNNNWPEGVLPARRLKKALAEPGAVALKLRPQKLHMHQVAIHANPNDFLDKEKPVGEQLPRHQEALKAMGYHEKEGVHKALRDTDALREHGIAGAKYTDPSGATSYEVAHPEIVEVQRRYASGGRAKRARGGYVKKDVGLGAEKVFWLKNWEHQDHPILKNPSREDLLDLTEPPRGGKKADWDRSSLRFLQTPHGDTYIFPKDGLIHDMAAKHLISQGEPGFEGYQSSLGGEDRNYGEVRGGNLYRIGPREFHSDEEPKTASLMRGATKKRDVAARGGRFNLRQMNDALGYKSPPVTRAAPPEVGPEGRPFRDDPPPRMAPVIMANHRDHGWMRILSGNGSAAENNWKNDIGNWNHEGIAPSGMVRDSLRSWLYPEEYKRMHKAQGGKIKRAHGGHIHATHGHRMRTKIHTGAIRSAISGRTDHLPVHVLSGSYVLPANVVSALGESNTLAGFAVAKSMFSQPIYGQRKLGAGAPYGGAGLPYGQPEPHRADGGEVQSVPVVLSGGEFVLTPAEVMRVGHGDLDTGHKILDAFVMAVRKKDLKTIKSLPGPSRD